MIDKKEHPRAGFPDMSNNGQALNLDLTKLR